MFFCRDCIARHEWKPTGFFTTDGDCELCWDRAVKIYDVVPKRIESPTNPIFDAQHPLSESATLFNEAGKTIDNVENFYYYKQCENLFIHFRKGVRAGQIDYDTTERFLKPINVTINSVQDWKATYKRRLRAKQSYQLAEERIGG